MIHPSSFLLLSLPSPLSPPLLPGASCSAVRPASQSACARTFWTYRWVIKTPMVAESSMASHIFETMSPVISYSSIQTRRPQALRRSATLMTRSWLLRPRSSVPQSCVWKKREARRERRGGTVSVGEERRLRSLALGEGRAVMGLVEVELWRERKRERERKKREREQRFLFLMRLEEIRTHTQHTHTHTHTFCSHTHTLFLKDALSPFHNLSLPPALSRLLVPSLPPSLSAEDQR